MRAQTRAWFMDKRRNLRFGEKWNEKIEVGSWVLRCRHHDGDDWGATFG
jgi:hypothetical protein